MPEAGGATGLVGELVLAALYLEPSVERERALRRAVGAVGDHEAALLALESHGVLGLARRNLDRAGASLPDALAGGLAQRCEVLREEDLCFRLTLERFLDEAAAAGIDVTLLKGASLALDLYTEPALRSQADLDLLVAEDDVSAAVGCGARSGLVLDERSFPVWWYRRAHFHLKLRPVLPMLRQVELHWALHHPSQLLGPPHDDMCLRRVPVGVGQHRALALDPLDRVLHLVTHLARHAAQAWGPPDREHLLSIAATPAHPLRLKWIVDVRAELERSGGRLRADALVDRADEWRARGDLRWCLAWIRSALGLLPDADELVREVLTSTESGVSGARPSRGAATFGRGPLSAFDFRPVALARLPRWIWPPAGYFARGGGRGGALVLRRVAHAVRVGFFALSTASLLPVALAGRGMLRGARRRAFQAARTAERVLDVAARWRELARREEAKAAGTRARSVEPC